MSTQRILAEKTVSVTEMIKHPADFFTDRPIAVLSKNQTAGYMLGKELYESMVDLIRQLQPVEPFAARFQASDAQLLTIAKGSARFLANANDEELGDFVE